MNVLLSIKPEFASKIFEGNKSFEYRRVIFKEPVERIIVYSSSPVKMVIGEFIISEILFENLDKLWHTTKHKAGISENYFYSYFSEKEKGYAIKIGRTIKYKTPCSIEDLYGIKPPQSFAYVKKLTINNSTSFYSFYNALHNAAPQVKPVPNAGIKINSPV